MRAAQQRLRQSLRRAGLGAALRAARTGAGLTLATVAHAIGKSASTVCDYEAGRREPRALTLFDAARTIGAELAALDAAARSER